MVVLGNAEAREHVPMTPTPSATAARSLRDFTRRQGLGGRVLLFLQGHPALMAAVPRSWVGRLAWFVIDTPSFREAMRESEADMAAGRWYRFDTGSREMTPNPDWPKDGPQPRHPLSDTTEGQIGRASCRERV